MALVNVSLDTATRQVVLTINGVMVPVTDCWLEKHVYDGEEFIRFSYTIESSNSDGLKERRQYYLPTPEELATVAHAGLNANGFASKIVYDDEKAKADAIDFFQKNRASRQ